MRKLILAVVTLLLVVSSIGTAAAERQANCFGDPPRQTEDLLSPACVPFFDDEDNGGATDDGVTADEIRLVLYNDLGVDGDMNEPWRPSDEATDARLRYEQRDLVRTIKAHLRYFASRFQTYRRTVRVIARSSGSGLATPCAGRQAEAAKARLDVDPFAAISIGGGEISCFADYLAEHFGRPTFMYGGELDRDVQARRPGMIWSFMPDLQQQARASAGFICRKLAGRPPRFTDDPLLTGERSFGIVYPARSQRGPEQRDGALELARALRRRCGLSVETATWQGLTSGIPTEAPEIMARWKLLGITTAICYCVPTAPEHAVTLFQRSASALAYQPEWFWDSFSAMDKPMWQQQYGDPRQRSFGASHFWRLPALRQQRHYQAYLEQEPQSVPNTRFSWHIYHMFLQAFTAIQLAGPNLTAPNVEAGLRTHAIDIPTNPFVPRASYLNGDSFVDSFTGWWWDPAGTPPDGRKGEGCNRLLKEGYAFAPGTWTPGDADLFTSDAPCGAANQTAAP